MLTFPDHEAEVCRRYRHRAIGERFSNRRLHSSHSDETPFLAAGDADGRRRSWSRHRAGGACGATTPLRPASEPAAPRFPAMAVRGGGASTREIAGANSGANSAGAPDAPRTSRGARTCDAGIDKPRNIRAVRRESDPFVTIEPRRSRPNH